MLADISSPASLVPFVVGSVLVTIVPGPDMALITRQVLAYGQRVARATIAGNVAGLVVHTVGVAFGLSAILLGSARVFEVVKLLGAAYLIYLGVMTFRHTRTPVPGTDQVRERQVISRRTAFRQGFLSTTLNPKPALFFATFLPQFVDPDGNVALQVLGLGAFHILVGVVWLTTYALLIGRLQFVLTREDVRRWLERATGAVLVALGVRVAFSDR
jgi:threonine/homoserine/homoserine lactone efflux protein